MNIKAKRLVMASLLAAASMITGCGGSEKQAKESGVIRLPEQNGRKVYFAYDDPRYDDNGTGRYRYPLNFNNREGYLDITRFTVEDGGANVIFTINCRRPIERYREDGSTEPKGWWLQMIDIYIDKDGSESNESGYVKALPGRQIGFKGKSGWEKMVLVTPNHSRTVEKILEDRTSDMDLVHQRKDIIIPHRVYPQGFTFVAYVPKHELGAPKPGWGYQVLMVPYDGSNLSYGHFQNRKISKFASDDKFGGGTDYDGNPNVMDILAPSESAQSRILSNYHSAPYAGDNRVATVDFMYNSQKTLATAFKAPGANSPATAYKPFATGSNKAPTAVSNAPVERTQTYTPSVNNRAPGTSMTPAEKYKSITSSENQSPVPNNNLKIHSFEGGF